MIYISYNPLKDDSPTDVRKDRWQKRGRLTEERSQESLSAELHQDEMLYKFFSGDLNFYFKNIAEQSLFIKLANAEGIESWKRWNIHQYFETNKTNNPSTILISIACKAVDHEEYSE